MFVVHLTVEQVEAAPFFPLEMFVGSLYVGSWWIMDYGCNIHTTDIQGNTALMIAAQHGALRCTTVVAIAVKRPINCASGAWSRSAICLSGRSQSRRGHAAPYFLCVISIATTAIPTTALGAVRYWMQSFPGSIRSHANECGAVRVQYSVSQRQPIHSGHSTECDL